jgi:hypothetical protein
MKYWKSKNNLKALKIDSVCFWNYTPAEKNHHSIKSNLHVFLYGGDISFSGEEADEIYNILQSQKEVL